MAVIATTELEAVNIMLGVITEAPIATLDDDTIEDAQVAVTTLRQVSKEVQAEGWHFNREYDYPLPVSSSTGKIAYPPTASHVDAMDHTGYDVAKRGAFLYDMFNHTFDFSSIESLKCVIVWMLDFEDLPQPARTYIALAAARRFAKNVMGDEATVQFTAEDEGRARGLFVADDMRRADLNMLRDSRSVNRIVHRSRRGF